MKNLSLLKKRKKGFTLVEILVVIVIIGLLFAIFVPRIDFASNSARETGVKSDFRAFMLATEQTMRENAGLGFVTGATADSATTNTNTTAVIGKLNQYLDPALQLSVASGTNKALSAQLDPWNKQYQMVTNAKKGANNCKILFECGGKDSAIDGNNDFILLTTYTDGTIKSATNGFSSNIGAITNVPAAGTQANTKLDGTGSMIIN
ncbi:MAG: prepilin-type N-terminal cleavage/methylation domain-containing protein [Oscillospiraceae bacterium]|nr:prepilin-type N-terminal cleavage/methylation domain-containing protein [Oscillospiraceae bacterium]